MVLMHTEILGETVFQFVKSKFANCFIAITVQENLYLNFVGSKICLNL